MSSSLRLEYVLEISFRLETYGLLIRSGKAREVLGLADIMPMAIEYPFVIDNRKYVLSVPYIPGSSLKGRARALLETALGLPLYTTDGKIYLHTRIVRNEIRDEDPYCPVDNVFGTPAIPPNMVAEEKRFILDCWAPTRAIFRDLFPSDEYLRRLCDAKGGCEGVQLADFLEEKWENRIDRVTSTADPRNIMRLRPGVEFKGHISFLIYDLDVCRKPVCDEKSQRRELIVGKYKGVPALYYLDMLIDSLKLVERTYLGASGTRGYGTVKFKGITARLYDVGGNLVNEISVEDLDKFKEAALRLPLECRK
ncbi:type III-A CRISPR-associated RAMP protein Csm3 [Pyrobaculum aerophilum]|uniref:CRISPR system Cms endoribonuclease Csm3 n=1 Tax=Pyrobaculum aerophilum TaxID=13773 RepID=A0A371R1F0_9CREN|nr:type III-A CRISPR-associated RAMP protein Csm3 [Pyrobaculum aerophilum]RFA95074.1 type III-A CRISPR-associated RAMP protein Csm3 [Pyrobaculum aerophilum]RFA97309.1 type III-A CRISPR-associated RAMP protein Csm3 [Pyrobaculum aerophilum]